MPDNGVLQGIASNADKDSIALYASKVVNARTSPYRTRYGDKS